MDAGANDSGLGVECGLEKQWSDGAMCWHGSYTFIQNPYWDSNICFKSVAYFSSSGQYEPAEHPRETWNLEFDVLQASNQLLTPVSSGCYVIWIQSTLWIEPKWNINFVAHWRVMAELYPDKVLLPSCQGESGNLP